MNAYQRRGSKYGAIPTIYNGVRYASKSEAAYAARLDLMVKAGEVRWWIGQPVFRLGVPENRYVGDFLVVPFFRLPYVVDVKGARTAKFNRDVKLWAAYGPCELHIVSGKKLEIITPNGDAK